MDNTDALHRIARLTLRNRWRVQALSRRTRPPSSVPARWDDEAELAQARGTREPLLTDLDLGEIERIYPGGLTSKQIVDLFEARGIRLSEATFRKYVQLGMLPRS